MKGVTPKFLEADDKSIYDKFSESSDRMLKAWQDYHDSFFDAKGNVIHPVKRKQPFYRQKEQFRRW